MKNKKRNDKKLFGFEKFDVYQSSIKFAKNMYSKTQNFPKSEQFGLTSQLRRASFSIPLNIAEGYSKYSKKEKKRHYRIAKGSAHECIPGLTLSFELDYITEEN